MNAILGIDAAWCGTRSPTRARPGKLSDVIRAEFEREGYALRTKGPVSKIPGLIEVYPHAALLGPMNRAERAEYKVEKTRTYWHQETSVAERRRRPLESHREILRCPKNEIDAIGLPLPRPDSLGGLASLKRFEDALDALVCCWVGIRYLEGEAVACGDQDDDAAIWVPTQSFAAAGAVSGPDQALSLRPCGRRGD